MIKEKITVIVLDVDGTLTDGTINIGQSGELFKSFYCRDGLAIIRAIECGMDVVILTSRVSEIVNQRAKELGITLVLQGAKGRKEKLLLQYMEQHQLNKENIAYMGDDINDLDSMQHCGIVACPMDAVDEVKMRADYISHKNGGYGAVRDFIDWLLNDNFC